MGRLSDADVKARLSSVPGWAQKGNTIEKAYAFDDFAAAMTFANRVADLAERMDHHPDMLVQYGKVTLTLSSHDSGGLTERDFTLAAQIDA
jgi:4a-hydroxytetrahydrobiopterin dehydratase